MRPLTLSALLLASALAAACGGGGAADDSGSSTNPTQPLPGIYVNAATGSDTTGDGSFDRPFKSIKRGVTAAGFGDVVRVAAGTYDAANGEFFPIVPGFGVTIVGTERHGVFGRIQLTKVVGGGLWSGDPEGRLHATLVPNVDNHVVGLSLENPQPFVIGGAKPAAVVMANPDVTLESCSLHDSDKGVRMVLGVRDTLMKGCTFSDNGIGIFVDGAGTRNRVENCLVTENGTGVMLFSPGVDFGGDLSGSVGGNAFTQNDVNDIVHFAGSGETIYAAFCFWDHAPPTMAAGNPPSSPNADIWMMDPSAIVVAGDAQVYVGPVLDPGPIVGP